MTKLFMIYSQFYTKICSKYQYFINFQGSTKNLWLIPGLSKNNKIHDLFTVFLQLSGHPDIVAYTYQSKIVHKRQLK